MTFPARPGFPRSRRGTVLHFKSAKSREAFRHGRSIQSAEGETPRWKGDKPLSFGQPWDHPLYSFERRTTVHASFFFFRFIN